MLVSEYFIDENRHLLSVCGMVNTHSAAGRMLMIQLADYNEFERAMISERTSETLQHLKAQGVRLGPAPYGYELSNQLDGNGRRLLVPLASEQEIIARLAAAEAAGVGFNDIARQLNAEGIRARRGGECGVPVDERPVQPHCPGPGCRFARLPVVARWRRHRGKMTESGKLAHSAEGDFDPRVTVKRRAPTPPAVVTPAAWFRRPQPA